MKSSNAFANSPDAARIRLLIDVGLLNALGEASNHDKLTLNSEAFDQGATRSRNWRTHWKELVLLVALLLIALLFGLGIIAAGEAAALSTPLIAALVAFSLYETVHDKPRS